MRPGQCQCCPLSRLLPRSEQRKLSLDAQCAIIRQLSSSVKYEFVEETNREFLEPFQTSGSIDILFEIFGSTITYSFYYICRLLPRRATPGGDNVHGECDSLPADAVARQVQRRADYLRD